MFFVQIPRPSIKGQNSNSKGASSAGTLQVLPVDSPAYVLCCEFLVSCFLSSAPSASGTILIVYDRIADSVYFAPTDEFLPHLRNTTAS